MALSHPSSVFAAYSARFPASLLNLRSLTRAITVFIQVAATYKRRFFQHIKIPLIFIGLTDISCTKRKIYSKYLYINIPQGIFRGCQGVLWDWHGIFWAPHFYSGSNLHCWQVNLQSFWIKFIPQAAEGMNPQRNGNASAQSAKAVHVPTQGLTVPLTFSTVAALAVATPANRSF